ncbi:MAG: hypothetical protein JSW64_07105 [Candidatus Zixiibacteriota bacterium]|nr:MAG: hypothetical protein JSW64_07105 [candidate division Zixibacteria bacterium]
MKKSNPLRFHFILFLALSIVAIAQLSWWVIFQVQEGGRITSLQQSIWDQQKQIASLYLNNSDLSEIDKSTWLKANFPDLELDKEYGNLKITPEAIQRLDDLAQKRVRMFVSEGAFFSLLVLTGVWFFYWALRRRIELENKTAGILGAAHSGMKGPISAIERNVEALLNSEKMDRDQKSLLSEIGAELQKVSDICENVSLIQMLAISKGKTDLIATDISESTASIISEYKTKLLRSGLKIEPEIEEGLTAVTNPGQWLKVVLGILRVAEYNSGENSSVVLGLRRKKELAELKVRCSPDIKDRKMLDIYANIESEMGIIRELAETIGVKIKVEIEDNNSICVTAELPLLEE